MEELEKVAASLQATNNKNYWGILKRLYGGGDRAVSELGKDPLKQYVFHGTSAPATRKIMKEGLKPGNTRNFYGNGAYFGDNYVSHEYMRESMPGMPGMIRLKTPREATKNNVLIPSRTKFKKIEGIPPNISKFKVGDSQYNNTQLVPAGDVLHASYANRSTREAFEQYGKVNDSHIKLDNHIHISETLPPNVLHRPHMTKKFRKQLTYAKMKEDGYLDFL